MIQLLTAEHQGYEERMDILKSSRHSKITGDFGEALVLYWLSKYGFECARVDHTGIDLIARNPHTEEVMGISVKSRSRNTGREQTHVRIPDDDFVKVEAACAAFKCIAYFAIVIDAADTIQVFLLPMDHLKSLCKTETGASWRMSSKNLEKYVIDPSIKRFELHTHTAHWWKTQRVAEPESVE